MEFSLMEGLRVIECEGYLPISMLGKILKDFGAEVVLVRGKEIPEMNIINSIHEGKNELYLDLKSKIESGMFETVIKNSDILIESYRPGTLEKLGLFPENLLKINPKLIIVRLSGYGENGEMKNFPGHDNNYLSLAGVLEFFRENSTSKPVFPHTLLGDIFGGATMTLYYITQALVLRGLTGKGTIIDSSIENNSFVLNGFSSNQIDEEFLHFTFESKDKKFFVLKIRNNEKISENFNYVLEKLGYKIKKEVKTSTIQFKSIFRQVSKEFFENDFEKLFKLNLDISIFPILSNEQVLEEFPNNGINEIMTKSIFGYQVKNGKSTKYGADTKNQKEYLIRIGFSKNQIDFYLKNQKTRVIKPKL